MTLGLVWSSILLLAGIGALLLGGGIALSCTRRKWKLRRAVTDAMTTTGTILAIIAFYAAFVVATTELVVTVTNAFD